jgi:23S rRNA pseudouridine2605 synthase
MGFARDTHISERLPGERIAKVIARSGLCSRRDAERLVAEGRVTVNGKRLDSPAVNVTANDKILVDGTELPTAEPVRLWRYHKPKGRVTTHRDPEGRPTVFEALPDNMPRVISVGRLDFNTEGLLLLTNDGELARHLEQPATGWLRRYRVRANGKIAQAQLDALAKGVTVDGVRYAGIEARLDREQGANVWLTLVLREGKNREVRRIMEHLGLSVNRLIRMSFGPFALGDLTVGAVEEVKRRVLADQLSDEVAGRLGLKEKQQHRHGENASGGGKEREQKRAPRSRNAAPTKAAATKAAAKSSAKSRKPKGRS